jgi:hypothetical protein
MGELSDYKDRPPATITLIARRINVPGLPWLPFSMEEKSAQARIGRANAVAINTPLSMNVRVFASV